MNPELQKRLDFLRSIGFHISEENIASLTERSKKGEDVESMWRDVLKYIVGSQRRVAANWIQSLFGDEQISGERMGRLVDDLVSGKRTFHQMEQDILKATGQSKDTQGRGNQDPENDLQIMGGPHKWYRTKDGDWYVAYQAPGNQWIYFEVSDDEMDRIFGDGIRPHSSKVTVIGSEKDLLKLGNYHFGGTVAEVTGDGNFLNEANKALERALAEGKLPDWLDMQASQQIMGLVYVYMSQDKSEEWLIEQIAKTNAFQKRYAGIEHFRDQGMSWIEAVASYREYENSLKMLYQKRGIKQNVTPDLVKKLLDKGHSIDDVAFVYDSFDLLERNAQAFKAFNDILRAQGRKTLSKRDQLAFLQGHAPKELYELWEQFSVLHAAREAGIGKYMSVQEAIRLAEKTAGIQSMETISTGMQRAAALALRYRAQIDVKKYGLTADDLIDMSMGLKPRSGRSVAELEQIMQRISAEAEGFLRQQASPYIGFSEEGRPGAASLGASRRVGL